VLDEGEDLNSPRVIDAAGPAAVVLYHATYERGGATAVDALPGGHGVRRSRRTRKMSDISSSTRDI
jgi:5,10-methylenetetrahydromethanopterin reductase